MLQDFAAGRALRWRPAGLTACLSVWVAAGLFGAGQGSALRPLPWVGSILIAAQAGAASVSNQKLILPFFVPLREIVGRMGNHGLNACQARAKGR